MHRWMMRYHQLCAMTRNIQRQKVLPTFRPDDVFTSDAHQFADFT